MFDAADIAAMLDAVGETATTDVGAVTVSFFAPGQQLNMFEGSVIVTDPSAMLATADIATHRLSGDPDGSIITINSIRYQIRSIIPEGDGFSLLEMREA